jgi:hypothetical protein
MRGYKIFGPNYTCLEYRYRLDDLNIYYGKIKPCESGFHFCPIAVNCLQYYPCTPGNTYAEVECGKDYIVQDDKVVCSELRIVKTLTFDEFKNLATGTIDTPTLKCSYVGGLLEGSYKRFYDNGKVWVGTNCVENKRHGSYKEWYENRQLDVETTYVNGKLDGSYKEWYENGQLYVETTYVDGKMLYDNV